MFLSDCIHKFLLFMYNMRINVINALMNEFRPVLLCVKCKR